MQEIIVIFSFCLLNLTAVIILILYLRKNDSLIDYDKYIELVKKQTTENLSILSNGNKEINRIEKEIRDCKKKLGMSLIKHKNK